MGTNVRWVMILGMFWLPLFDGGGWIIICSLQPLCSCQAFAWMRSGDRLEVFASVGNQVSAQGHHQL